MLLVAYTLLLLPRLLQPSKLAHGRRRVPARLELVLREPFPLEHRRVDRLERNVALRPRKVQQPEAVDVTLVFGRDGYLWVVSKQRRGFGGSPTR